MKRKLRAVMFVIFILALIALVVVSSIMVFGTTLYENDIGLSKPVIVGIWCFGIVMVIGGILTAATTRSLKP